MDQKSLKYLVMNTMKNQTVPLISYYLEINKEYKMYYNFLIIALEHGKIING